VRNYLRTVITVVWKDIVGEARNKEILTSMLVFSLLVILIFNFALDLDVQAQESVTAGVLWVTFTFAGTLGVNRSMASEREGGCLDGLLLVPVDRSALYVGKALGNLLFLLVVEVIVLPIYSVLFNVNMLVPGFLLVVLLGSIGYIAVGTLLAAMSVQARTRDILLPILLFPLAIPILIPAVKASIGYLEGYPGPWIMTWLNVIIVYDLIFTAIAVILFEYVVEDWS